MEVEKEQVGPIHLQALFCFLICFFILYSFQQISHYAGIPNEGGKNANLTPLVARRAPRGRGGGNTGETMQGGWMDEIACHDHDILPLRKACTNGRHDSAFARHSKQKSKVLGAGCSLLPWLDPCF